MISFLTTRLRRFAYDCFNDALKHQLDSHYQNLKTLTFQSDVQTPTLHEVVPHAISISQMTELLSSVFANFEVWASCDLIIACPETLQGAKKAFPPEKVLLVQDFSNWVNIFISEATVPYLSLGVVSPSIVEKLANDVVLVNLLAQHIRRSLALMTYPAVKEYSDFRCLLHRSGFYEVVTLSPATAGQSEADSSTIGVLPHGAFDAQLKYPGLSPDFSGFRTLLASRVAIHNTCNLPWKGVIGCADLSVNASASMKSDQFALMINDELKAVEFSESLLIEGTAHWDTVNSGHASLVGCYNGPDDTNMYAALIEFAGDRANLALTLWRNSGEWSCLLRQVIVVEPVFDSYELTFWLKMTQSEVSVGIKNTIVLSIKDDIIPRNCQFGIRLFGNAFSLANIKCTRH